MPLPLTPFKGFSSAGSALRRQHIQLSFFTGRPPTLQMRIQQLHDSKLGTRFEVIRSLQRQNDWGDWGASLKVLAVDLCLLIIRLRKMGSVRRLAAHLGHHMYASRYMEAVMHGENQPHLFGLIARVSCGVRIVLAKPTQHVALLGVLHFIYQSLPDRVAPLAQCDAQDSVPTIS